MTATDELRRMLDECGVEWVDTGDGSTLIPAQTATNVAWDVNTWPSGKDMGDCLWVQNRHPLTPKQAIAATLGETPTPPPPTPPKQPPYDELIDSLRRDWDIEASWDGLRRFWYVGLTDEGVRKRDEREATLGRGTCEVEAENAKLRELVRVFYHCTTSGECDECPINGGSTVHLMPDTICGTIHDRMRGLGVEVVE